MADLDLRCDRPGCRTPTLDDDLYCSDACFQADNDDLCISPVGRNDSGFVGGPATRGRRVPLSVWRMNMDAYMPGQVEAGDV